MGSLDKNYKTMEFKGAELLGVNYGQVSPVDYQGLKLWLRSTDGITVNNRGAVIKWKDLSGVSGDWSVTTQPYNEDEVGYYISYGASGTGNIIGTLNTLMFSNGNPFSMIIVGNIIGASLQSNGGNKVAFGHYNTGTMQLTIGNGNSPANTPSQRMLYYSAGINSGGNSGIGKEFRSYGYGSSLPQSAIYKGGILAGTGNYLNPPGNISGPTTNIGFLSFAANNGLKLREIILFDHLGKTRDQIESEMNTLTKLYLKPRYPSLYNL
jgi:hypothetical protein